MNKKELPLVSLCIPIFNGEEFIQEALKSVQSQTYPNLELIVSDDGSEDTSIEIIKKHLVDLPFRCKLVANVSQGIGENWNNCILHASGKYIKFLFQDDILYPDCVNEMIVLAEADDKVGMVFSDRQILMDKSKISHLKWFKTNGELNHYWDRPLKTGIYPGKQILKDKNLFRVKPWNKIGEPSSMLFRKSVFGKMGLFDTELIQFLDLEFSLRVLSQYKFGYIQKQLTGFRLHEKQASSRFSKKNISERSILLRKLSLAFFFQLSWYSKKILIAEYFPNWLLKVIKRKNKF